MQLSCLALYAYIALVMAKFFGNGLFIEEL